MIPTLRLHRVVLRRHLYDPPGKRNDECYGNLGFSRARETSFGRPTSVVYYYLKKSSLLHSYGRLKKIKRVDKGFNSLFFIRMRKVRKRKNHLKDTISLF